MGVLQPATVLDVRVLASCSATSTAERRALHTALVQLVGEDLGATPAAWRSRFPHAPAPAR